MTDRFIQIPTRPEMGRSFIHHDERSKDFRAVDVLRGAVATTKPRDRTWRRGGAYDQAYTTTCVPQTGKGILNTLPISRKIDYDIRSEYSIDELYDGAREYDEWPGVDYDGTSGLGLCKYMKIRNLIDEYRWCFGLNEVLLTLSHIGPIGLGVMWKTGMWETDDRGFISPTGADEGGHEVELIGVDVSEKSVIGMNSWGPGWGVKGRFKLTWDGLEELLDNQGDAFVILR